MADARQVGADKRAAVRAAVSAFLGSGARDSGAEDPLTINVVGRCELRCCDAVPGNDGPKPGCFHKASILKGKRFYFIFF